MKANDVFAPDPPVAPMTLIGIFKLGLEFCCNGGIMNGAAVFPAAAAAICICCICACIISNCCCCCWYMTAIWGGMEGCCVVADAPDKPMRGSKIGFGADSVTLVSSSSREVVLERKLNADDLLSEAEFWAMFASFSFSDGEGLIATSPNKSAGAVDDVAGTSAGSATIVPKKSGSTTAGAGAGAAGGGAVLLTVIPPNNELPVSMAAGGRISLGGAGGGACGGTDGSLPKSNRLGAGACCTGAGAAAPALGATC